MGSIIIENWYSIIDETWVHHRISGASNLQRFHRAMHRRNIGAEDLAACLASKRYAQDVLIQIIRKAVYKSTAPETLAALPFVARAAVVSDY